MAELVDAIEETVPSVVATFKVLLILAISGRHGQEQVAQIDNRFAGFAKKRNGWMEDVVHPSVVFALPLGWVLPSTSSPVVCAAHPSKNEGMESFTLVQNRLKFLAVLGVESRYRFVVRAVCGYEFALMRMLDVLPALKGVL